MSTIVDSDKIIVLKEGKAVEVGSHSNLLQLNGEYKKMWDIQSSDKTDKKVSTENKVSQF